MAPEHRSRRSQLVAMGGCLVPSELQKQSKSAEFQVSEAVQSPRPSRFLGNRS